MYESHRKPRRQNALWARKAATDRKEEFYDPAREEDISRRNKNAIGVVGRTS